MIQQMSKVRIIGSKLIMNEVVELLHTLGTVHIEEVPRETGLGDYFLRGVPVDKDRVALKGWLEKILDKLKTLTILLPPSSTVTDIRYPISSVTSDVFLEALERLETEARNLQKREVELKDELSSLGRYERILRGLAPLITRLEGIKAYETVGLTFDRSKAGVIPLLEEEIKRITEGRYELFVRDIDEETAGIVIAYPRTFAKPVKELITGEAISEIRLPKDYEGLTFFDALTIMLKRKGSIPSDMEKVSAAIKGLSDRWYPEVSRLMEVVRDAIDEISILRFCSETHYAFIITGWIPSPDFQSLVKALRERFEDRVIATEIEIKGEEIDLIPVYLKNPRLLKPFEVFLNVLPPPKYGSVDPTPFVAFFFPTFFGLMVGDIGYGILILFFGLYIRRRFRERKVLRDLGYVMTLSSIFCIVFGFIFGEFFGDLGERLGIIHPTVMDRTKALTAFLVMAIGLGVGHTILGLIIAIVNHIHRGRGRDALAKGSSLVFVLSLLLVIGTMTRHFPPELLSTGVIVLVTALFFLIFFEGILGPVEAMKTIGNIISYARIMAIGTASVVLAMVANRMVELTDNLALGIVVASIIHLLNAVLAVFSPAIHSIRLHYVEFFSKFYQTGGRRYEPFRRHEAEASSEGKGHET